MTVRAALTSEAMNYRHPIDRFAESADAGIKGIPIRDGADDRLKTVKAGAKRQSRAPRGVSPRVTSPVGIVPSCTTLAGPWALTEDRSLIGSLLTKEATIRTSHHPDYT